MLARLAEVVVTTLMPHGHYSSMAASSAAPSRSFFIGMPQIDSKLSGCWAGTWCATLASTLSASVVPTF